MSDINRIPIGPYHPLLEEAEYYEFEVEGEKIKSVDMRIGWMHRGIEKLSEGKHFEQSIYLVERVCGICSTSHPIAFVNAVENLAGIEIPERAAYIRTIIGELERIHSHLLWVGLAGHFIGFDTLFMWAWKYREPILELFEHITGNRNSYGMMVIGGVKRDIKNEDIPGIINVLKEVERNLLVLKKAAETDPVLKARLKGIGILTKKDAIDYGAVGPTARASGVAIDVRKDDPYAAYPWLDWEVVVLEDGDVYAKLLVRVLEMFESIKMIVQSLEALKKVKGPIQADVWEIPAGEGIGRHEAPRGEVLHYVRTDGSNMTVRHKIRAPSYVNIPTYEVTCPGYELADALIITAAVDPCYCCTERAVVVKKGDSVFTGEDLIEISRRKTEELRKKCV